MSLSRRHLLRRSATTGLGIALVGGLDVLTGPPQAFAGPRPVAGYGPLLPDSAGMLDLPRGFRYSVVTRAGEPLAGHGGVVPGAPDGTASFRGRRGHTLLVNNHEQTTGAKFRATAAPVFTYDPGADGGTTTIEVDAANQIVEEYVSVAGTAQNCAGGVTPWRTWLTCEETEARAGDVLTREHGYIFEVDPVDPGRNRDPQPLTAMGRFAHEAVAVDPATGVCYETEDASDPNGLFYRFTPRVRPGSLHSLRAGGLLETMRARDLPDLSAATEVGATYPVSWTEVPDPLARTTSTRVQLPDSQVSRSRKLEGAWWGDGGCYFVASFARTSDGSVQQHDGQIWFHDPVAQTITLKLRMAVTPDESDLDGPDNITVSPYGGVLVAEDGEGEQHLFGVTVGGEPYALARNALGNGSEFTGPNFSPDGRTLFVNIQTPGIVFAVTGPWQTASAWGRAAAGR